MTQFTCTDEHDLYSGMGLTFLAANGNQSDAVLVMSQIIIGIGVSVSFTKRCECVS